MLQTILLLVISILTTASAQLCFKKGVLKLGELSFSFSGILSLIPKIMQNIWLVLGIFLFGISFLLWLFILSKLKLNIAYPIAVSVEVSLASLGAWIFFHEYLSLIQIIGIIIVIIGIFFILPKGTF